MMTGVLGLGGESAGRVLDSCWVRVRGMTLRALR